MEPFMEISGRQASEGWILLMKRMTLPALLN